jgi:hypothetical protein
LPFFIEAFFIEALPVLDHCVIELGFQADALIASDHCFRSVHEGLRTNL